MGKDSMVLRDLLASVISGTTLNVEQSTATDLVRGIIQESTTSTDWSNTTISYEVSGYTISSSDPDAVLTDFYCNTGSTLQVLLTGDTIIQSYISGTTIVPTGTTITEIITTTTGTTISPNNLLKVNLYGVSGITVVNGTNGTSGTSGASLTGYTSGTVVVTDYLYFGDSINDGSWRIDISGDDLIVEKRIDGNWITKGTFIGS